MNCEKCGGNLISESIKDYYGETWQNRCDACGHVQDQRWYHDGYWDGDDDDCDEEDALLEIAIQDCGLNDEEDYCKWEGSYDCDSCPFQHKLYDNEQEA